MKTDVEALRKKYMDNPPEGLTSTDIRHMSEDDLLDMDYFLNDDDLDEEFGEVRFLSFLIPRSSICVARLPAGIFNSKERRRRSFL